MGVSRQFSPLNLLKKGVIGLKMTGNSLQTARFNGGKKGKVAFPISSLVGKNGKPRTVFGFGGRKWEEGGQLTGYPVDQLTS